MVLPIEDIAVYPDNEAAMGDIALQPYPYRPSQEIGAPEQSRLAKTQMYKVNAEFVIVVGGMVVGGDVVGRSGVVVGETTTTFTETPAKNELTMHAFTGNPTAD